MKYPEKLAVGDVVEVSYMGIITGIEQNDLYNGGVRYSVKTEKPYAIAAVSDVYITPAPTPENTGIQTGLDTE
jgi:hypothetical protein